MSAIRATVITSTNPLKALASYGQSVWLDYIRRSLITSGELQRHIDEDGLTGVTSNPAIFEKAIGGGNEYDAQVNTLLRDKPGEGIELSFGHGRDAGEVSRELAQRGKVNQLIVVEVIKIAKNFAQARLDLRSDLRQLVIANGVLGLRCDRRRRRDERAEQEYDENAPAHG